MAGELAWSPFFLLLIILSGSSISIFILAIYVSVFQ